MGNGDGVVGRLPTPARLEDLKHLEAELRAAGSPGSGPVRAEQTGRVLAVAGALLRRLHSSRVTVSDVQPALRLVSSEALEAWRRSVDLPALEARLRRASEEAVEAAIPESPEDRDTWLAWAGEGVQARDRVESQLVALRAREELGFAGDRPLRERLAAAVAAQDASLRSRSRWLVALNAARRQERDALDPELRAQAWWFTDRAECDDLLPLLAGEPIHSAHIDGCAECQRDLAKVKGVGRARTRHLSEDELWNLDLGLVSSQERAVIDAHLRLCGDCSQAVAALEEGEETIRELTSTARASVTVLPTAARTRTADQPEVLAEHADFRLLLFQRRERTRVVVQPRRQGRVAAAAVFVADDPRHALSARPGPDGFEVEVAESLKARGAASIRVRLSGAGSGTGSGSGSGSGEDEVTLSLWDRSPSAPQRGT